MAGLLMLPQKRYQSYILCRLNAVGQELERSGGATFLSSFFTGIPRENGRILQAQNMVGIAMRWILLHEESHYIEGHLSFADQLRVAGEIETINSTVSHIPLATDALRRVIEWHADRSATESEFDLLMSSYEAYAEQNVPHGVRSDEIMKYSLRFMMTTIGVVNLLFRLLEIRNGVSASYPSARTRLATMFFAVAKRNHEFHTRGDFRCSWDDYMRAVLGTLRDLDSASRLIGLEAKSGLSHVPMHSISEWEGKSELQLFDDVSEHVYVAAKICAEVGFRTDAFGVSFDVSPRGQVLNDLDQCWLGELGRTVESFDQCCHGAFLRFRVR